MADLKLIKEQAKAIKTKVTIDMSEIKKGAKVEYVPSKYMSVFNELEDEMAKEGLKKLKKNVKTKGNSVDMTKLLDGFLTDDSIGELRDLQVKQGEQIIARFDELPTPEESKEWFAEQFGDDVYETYYENFVITVLTEFNEAFNQVTPS